MAKITLRLNRKADFVFTLSGGYYKKVDGLARKILRLFPPRPTKFIKEINNLVTEWINNKLIGEISGDFGKDWAELHITNEKVQISFFREWFCPCVEQLKPVQYGIGWSGLMVAKWRIHLKAFDLGNKFFIITVRCFINEKGVFDGRGVFEICHVMKDHRGIIPMGQPYEAGIKRRLVIKFNKIFDKVYEHGKPYIKASIV